jgi:hypothetical protein
MNQQRKLLPGEKKSRRCACLELNRLKIKYIVVQM